MTYEKQLRDEIEKLRKISCAFSRPALLRVEICSRDSPDKCNVCLFAFKVLEVLDRKEGK